MAFRGLWNRTTLSPIQSLGPNLARSCRCPFPSMATISREPETTMYMASSNSPCRKRTSPVLSIKCSLPRSTISRAESGSPRNPGTDAKSSTIFFQETAFIDLPGNYQASRVFYLVGKTNGIFAKNAAQRCLETLM